MSNATTSSAEPRPWPAEWFLPDEGDCIIIDDDCNAVAIVGDPNGDPTPQDWRNARLIAAAPQMLEALRELVEAAASAGIRDELDGAAVDAAIDTALATIAAATGERV